MYALIKTGFTPKELRSIRPSLQGEGEKITPALRVGHKMFRQVIPAPDNTCAPREYAMLSFEGGN